MRRLSLLLLCFAPSLRAETIVYVSVADEHRIGACSRLGDVLARVVQRAPVQRRSQCLAAGIESGNGRVQPLTRRQRDRAADQTDADDGDAHSAPRH